MDPPLLADDSLDSMETVSLKAESLSGDSVRTESVFDKISSPVSNFKRGPSDEERLCVREICCDIF